MTQRNGFFDVDFTEAKTLLDECADTVLIDVRAEEEYITGHAADAALLPLDDMTEEAAAAAQPNKDAPVLVYCRTGARSEAAAALLAAFGYTRVYNIGSLVGWPYGLE